LWTKDQTGDLRGSEWEPIKILLDGYVFSNKMNTPNQNTSLTQTTQVGQDHVAIGVLLVPGTNNQRSLLENAAQQATRSTNHTGQTGHLHRSDRSRPDHPN
jgi:hypothetical protein